MTEELLNDLQREAREDGVADAELALSFEWTPADDPEPLTETFPLCDVLADRAEIPHGTQVTMEEFTQIAIGNALALRQKTKPPTPVPVVSITRRTPAPRKTSPKPKRGGPTKKYGSDVRKKVLPHPRPRKAA